MKTATKSLRLRIQVLTAELADAAKYGPAAVRCVKESLLDAERQLTELG